MTRAETDDWDRGRWYAPVVLTETEAAELRRILDDPAARAPGGVRVPLVDPAAVAGWHREKTRNIPIYSDKPAAGA